MSILAPDALPYADVTLEYDDLQLVNLAQIAREGGVQQVAADSDSQDVYLVHTYNRTDLQMRTDDAALDYAGWVVHLSADAELRFAELTIIPQRADSDLFPQVLGREIGDRVLVIRTPPGGGEAIARYCYVRGISHEGTSETWKTVWVLQAAEHYDEGIILDSPTQGVLDTNVLVF